MGHHLNAVGEFQSDKHPDLPPDRVRVNLTNPRSTRAMRVLADSYADKDAEFSEDLHTRLDVLYGPRSSACMLCGHAVSGHDEAGCRLECSCDYASLLERP